MQRREAAELLGVREQARKFEVRAAYRRRARQAHPDVGGDAESFDLVTHAYEVMQGHHRRERILRHPRPAAAAEQESTLRRNRAEPDEGDPDIHIQRNEPSGGTTSKHSADRWCVCTIKLINWNWVSFAALIWATYPAAFERGPWGTYTLFFKNLGHTNIQDHGQSATHWMIVLPVAISVAVTFGITALISRTRLPVPLRMILAFGAGMTWIGFWFGWWPGLIPLAAVIGVSMLINWSLVGKSTSP